MRALIPFLGIALYLMLAAACTPTAPVSGIGLLIPPPPPGTIPVWKFVCHIDRFRLTMMIEYVIIHPC